MTKDTEEPELLNVVFASVFTIQFGALLSQSLEAREEVWRNEDFPLIEENDNRDHLSKPDTHKSMAPNRMHPQVPRELADVTAKPLHL